MKEDVSAAFSPTSSLATQPLDGVGCRVAVIPLHRARPNGDNAGGEAEPSRTERASVTPLSRRPKNPEPADGDLVLAAREGSSWAQKALFERHAERMLTLAQRLIPYPDEAEDLAQDVFTYALGHLGALDNPQAFSKWLSTILIRTASKRFRRWKLMERWGMRRSQPVDFDTLLSPSAPPDVAAELRLMYASLNRLPAEERIALVLRKVEGLELTEIATQMKLSLATVKRRLAAANQRLLRESAEP